MLGYANSIRTIDGGAHIEGMKASLTRTINNLAKNSKVIKVLFILILTLYLLVVFAIFSCFCPNKRVLSSIGHLS